MNNELYLADGQLRQMKLLHHALRLPIALYRGSLLIKSMPKEHPDPRLLLEQTEILKTLRLRLQKGRAGYIYQSESKGHIAFVQDEEHVLLLGPVTKIAQEKLMSDTGNMMALQIKLASINEDSIFYIISLLEEFFIKPSSQSEKPTEEASIKASNDAMIDVAMRDSMSAFFSHPPYFLEQELAQAIKQGNRQSALSSLHEINRLERAQVAGDPLRSLKNSLIGSCALCSRAAISGGLSADSAFSLADSFIRSIEENNDLLELSNLEEEMVLCFSKQVEGLHRGEISNLVLGAMRYIDECLSEKLRLPEIAAQVYIHPDYLSTLFKKETGDNITRYIQKRRVQEACRFLRYSNYPITDIAEYFQFSSQSAFTKIFKQFQNLTPKQYREQSPT